MNDNDWLKSLHSERMKRRSGSGMEHDDERANAVITPEHGGDKKRKAEVIDLLDDDDEEEESPLDKKRRQQEESDAAFARRLASQEQAGGAFNRNPTAMVVPKVEPNTTQDDGFHKLASIIISQSSSRHDADDALQRLLRQCSGGTLTPRNVVRLGSHAIAGILCERSDRKANALIDLAHKWSSLPSCPTPRNGPCTAADKHFVTAITKSAKNGGVAGVGQWTLLTFMEELGRSDILNAGCHEVQQGARWLTGSADKPCTAAQVREFVVHSNVRPHSLTRVTGVLRELHRDVQAILSSGYGKKRKTPNSRDQVYVDAAIARARQELNGL